MGSRSRLWSAQAFVADLTVNPWQVVDYPGVKAGQIRASASASPRNQTDDFHAASDAFHVHRAAAVTLCVKKTY